MHEALSKLGTLPDDTLVFNGHEYTKGSVKFGLTIEPDNKELKGYVSSHYTSQYEVLVADGRLMQKAEKDSCTTGKSTIGDEKTWNVFMRLDTPEAQYVDLCMTCKKAYR
jgi:hydroxyacylglutathione hydrolase